MPIDEVGLERVHKIIEESYKNLDDASIQQRAFQESLKYLGSLLDEEHWFCTEKLTALIKESLQLFAFLGSNALSWLKMKIKIQLGRCHLYANVHEYINNLDEFDYERVLESLASTLAQVSFETDKNFDMTHQIFVLLYECLWGIDLLEKEELRDKFRTLFLGIQKNGKFLRIYDEVVPGMIYFLFDEKFEDFSLWAKKSLEKLSRKINSSEFASIAKIPFTISMDNYLKTNNALSNRSASIFWKGASVLFHYTEKNSIIADLSSQGWDIVGLTCSRLSENTSVILDILDVFSELLNVLGSTFWEQAMYCNPLSVIDVIFRNDYIHNMIKSINKDNKMSGDFSKVFVTPFIWIKSFINSLQNSNRHHSCSKFLFYFLEYFQHNEYPKENRDNYKILACQVLSLTFEILLKSESLDFDTYLILVEENRKVFENYLKIIVEELLFSNKVNSCVKAKACQLVGLVLSVDCKILQQEFYNITKKVESSVSTIVTIMNYSYGRIWDILIQNIQSHDLDIISQIFQSFSLLSYIEIIDTESERSAYFNKMFMDIILKMSQLLARFDEIDSNIFKAMLEVPEINYSVISLSFSPILEISQLSLNIIKQAYDCVDRYQAFRFNLSYNFVSTLMGLINVIDSFMDVQSFLVASQLVKTSITILDILCSSENGLLLLDEYNSKENQSILIILWSQFWIFLNMLFSFSLLWANDFPKVSMIAFLRNVLEMANNMVNYSKIYDSIILLNRVSDSKEILYGSHILSFQIQDCLKYSFSWLRLNDEALLVSTVDFICLLFFRLKVANIIVERNILTNLENFLRKKSHKTNLTNEQKVKLYSIFQEFDFILNKSNEINVDSLSTVKRQSCKDAETVINNANEKSKSDSEFFKLKKTFPESISEAKLKVQPKMTIELLNSKAMSSLIESKNNINRYNFKGLNYLKNRSTNYHGSNLKFSSIKQFRLELLKDKKKMNKVLKRVSRIGTDFTNSRLFGPEILELDNSVKNEDLERSLFSDSECEDNNTESTFLSKDDKIYPKIRQVERKSVQRLDCIDVTDKNPLFRQKLLKQKVDLLKMRLFPSLSPLHKQILQWDINYNEEIPPNANKQMYLEVKYKFQTPGAYMNTFEPLLLLECWQQIIKAKEENINQSFKIKIINRASVDEFIDLYVFVSYEIFYSVIISDSDILVISDALKPLEEVNSISCLAKVQAISKKDSVELTLRTYPSNKMNMLLRPNNELYGLKLFSLVTIQREYSALKKYLELCDDIISAKAQPLPLSSSDEIQRAMVIYNVNKPQAEAIVGVTKSTGFHLIQG
ncbi:hypothetical protein PMAC_001196 [Pneumocystis sp. 'macacae']|nr:hypothetical protein PMAC_001196 [Pneumocystis sp. 'macacae']